MATAQQASFSDLLRYYRLTAGLSQEALAERAGLSTRGISDLERGARHLPRPETVQLLAAALGLDATDRDRLFSAIRLAREPRVERADPPDRQLMVPLTPLLGREREELAVIQLLRQDRVRLVTLTGPGGVGKTRLALQVATTLLPDTPDGVIFVDLAPLRDPALVAATVATALGVRDTGGRPLPERLTEYLRPRGLLLVLDNLEQVLAAAPLASELLAACPRLTILATSRAALRLRGEHELPVSPLALPDVDALDTSPLAPEALRQYAAVELFLQRAQSVRPDFRLTPANAPAVAHICRRLDGLPLAIELAAVRIRVLTPAALLEHLDRRLAVLTGGAQDAPARQRTLRHAIDWSHDLLDDPARALYRRLSVFVGGCSLAGVEAVCDLGQAGVQGAGESGTSCTPASLASHPGGAHPPLLDTLTTLVHHQLVRMEDGPDGEPRFGMLETIREYATEQLAASGEVEALRQRHAAFFLSLAERVESQLLGPEQAAGLDHLARELGNLRAALRWAAEIGAAETGLRLAGALARFWWLQGYLSEGRGYLERLLALPESAAPTVARAVALQALGMLLTRHADFDDDTGGQAAARACYEEGLEIARALGDQPRAASVLRELGRLAGEISDFAVARPRLEESLEIARAMGDSDAIAQSLSELGSLALFEEDYARAGPFLTESLLLFRERGDIGNASFALFFLGHLAREQGNYAEAHARFAESLAILPLSQYRWALHGVLEGFACVAAAQGQAERALRLSGAATARRAAIEAAVGRTWRTKYRQWLAPAWQALGEARGTAVWDEGRTMTHDEALAYALGNAPASAPAPANISPGTLE